MNPQAVPSLTMNLIAKNMADQTNSTSSLLGNLTLATCPGIECTFPFHLYSKPRIKDSMQFSFLNFQWLFTFFFSLFWVKRFDGLDFLKRWKGKKIMFVGDSLSLNQWQSFLCLIHASVPSANTNLVRKEILSYATFQVIIICSSLLFFFFLFPFFVFLGRGQLFPLKIKIGVAFSYLF